MKHFKLLFAFLALFGAVNANAQTDVTNDYIQNADFSSTDGWEAVISAQFRDYGNGLIGSWTNYTAPATADETHLATEYCFGLECRWSTNYVSFVQTTQELLAGVYTLTYDVENVNGSTSSANYENRFYVQVGDNKVTDSSTEWMRGKSSWTTHTISFTVDDPSAATISLGFGTGSNNIGSGGTPSLYVSHLKLTYQSLLDGVKALWKEAREAAQDAAGNADYSNVSGAERDALNTEIAKAEPTTKEGYEEATTALQEATAAFTAAKDAYDTFENTKTLANTIDLAYADPDKKPTTDAVPASAEDAQAQTQILLVALRAYYESHALAEAVEGAVNMTESITNYNATDGNNGWTWTGNKNNPRNTESWTDANGKKDYMYFDGGSWGSTGWTTTMEQTITIPAGKYLLTAKGRASDGVTLTMSVGENSVALPNVNAAGNVFDRGWCDGSVEFETNGDPVTILVKATTTGYHQWFSVGDFRLVQLEEIEVPMADEDDYAALKAAVQPFMNGELGFDEGEYAPYNNVEAILLAEEIANLDEEKIANKEYTKEYIQGLTAAANATTIVANETEVNAIYDGEFANTEANATSGDINLPGWTKVQGIRLLVKDEATDPGLAYTDGKAAVFSWGGTTLTYGEQTGYTMPLNEGEVYELTFKIAGWRDGDFANVLTVSLDGQAQTINPNVPGKINDAEGNPFTEVKFYFTASADVDNSILTIYANHHFAIADLKLMKAQLTDLVLQENETAAPEKQYAATVTYARKLKKGLNTIVLPFETTAEEIGASTVLMYGGTHETGGKTFIHFDEVAADANGVITLKANTPYALVLDNEPTENLSFTNKEVSPAENLTITDNNNQYNFVGTYVAIPEGNDVITENDYVAKAATGQFQQAVGNGGTWLNSYRAYLKFVGTEAGSVAFNIGGEIIDGIEAVELMNKLTEGIYNLNGQKVSNAQKGIYIVNGKKVVLK